MLDFILVDWCRNCRYIYIHTCLSFEVPEELDNRQLSNQLSVFIYLFVFHPCLSYIKMYGGYCEQFPTLFELCVNWLVTNKRL